MNRYLFSVVALVTFVFAGCGRLTPDAGKENPLNFIVIYTDEMQFSDLACYGGAIPTPNIDQLASEGILFTNAYTTASMCTPSRYSVLTGQFPGRCSAASFMRENPMGQPYNIAWNSWITADKETLPRMLSKHGFVTGMAGKWHVGRAPEHMVFPEFLPDEQVENPETEAKLKKEQSLYKELVESQGGFDEANSVVWGNYDNHSLKALRFHNFPWMVKGALTFLERRKADSKPFFLYFAPTAVHGPNHVADLSKDMSYTPAGRDTTLSALSIDVKALKEELSRAEPKTRHRYAGVAQTDFAVRLLREKLAELELDRNTVIIYISDHNVEPGKATSYEKGIRVPMIIHWPGLAPGRTSQALVQNTDILPTILDAARIEQPAAYQLDGLSLLPILTDAKPSIRHFIFSENGYTRSVCDGTYKYITLRYPASLIGKMESGELPHVPSYVKAWPQAHSALAIHGFPHYFDQNQLYNLKEDPFEQHNLYEAMKGSGELRDLAEALEDHLQSFDHPFDLAPIPFMETEAYRELSKKNLEFDLLSIPWLSRDHGFILWPPEEE